MTDQELDAFTRIHLADYLQEREGWLIDKAESTKRSIKVRRGSDVLIVNEKPGGVWLYFNPHEPNDKGSIIHYLQSRRGQGYTLGHVRKELRGLPVPSAPAASWQATASEATPDKVRLRWRAGAALRGLPDYLASRGLDAETVAAFGAPIRTDQRGNLLFAHTDDAGQVMGYEIRSATFKGFSRGGLRHLCRFGPVDAGEPLKIALCESAVDALSLAQMVKRRDALFCSTGGVVGPNTLEAIKALSDRHAFAELLLAFDDDKAGVRYSQVVQEAVSNRLGGVRRLLPPSKDWNDVLQGRCRADALPSFNP